MSAQPKHLPHAQRCTSCRKGERGEGRTTCDRCYQRNQIRALGPDRDIELAISQRSLAFMTVVERLCQRWSIDDKGCIAQIKESLWREPMLVKQLAAAQDEIARLGAQE